MGPGLALIAAVALVAVLALSAALALSSWTRGEPETPPPGPAAVATP